MATQSNRIVLWLICLVVVTAAGIGFYSYRREGASDSVKDEMLAIIGEMDLPPAWHDEATLLVESAHPEAFSNALDVTEEHGRKFDDRVYYDELFRLISAWAREDGRTGLADRLANEQSRFSFHVTER